MSQGFVDILPSILKTYLESDPPPIFGCSCAQTTPEIQGVLHQILRCPYQGLMRRLYLEGKALELIALQFTQLVEQEKGHPLSPHSSYFDRSFVYQARDLLVQQLDHPPSLMELARQVGVGDYTLKRRFREVFGTTVFGYLYDCRMEQARVLLREKQMTITEVARRVGYTDPSAFGRAFRKKFGETPRMVLKGNSA